MKNKEEVLLKLSNNQQTHLQLSLASDLQSAFNKMIKGISDLEKKRNEMKSIYNSSIDGANTLFAKYGQSAKELGIDPNDFAPYKNFMETQKKLDSAYYNGN